MKKRTFAKHKYNASSCEHDGIRFDSKKEGAYYQQLKLRVKAGEVVFFLRQTPIHLPGNIVYRVDFQEFHADGTVHFIDIKGFDTPTSKTKRTIAESLYPITIEVK